MRIIQPDQDSDKEWFAWESINKCPLSRILTAYLNFITKIRNYHENLKMFTKFLKLSPKFIILSPNAQMNYE